MRRGSAGFTLLEVLVVIVVIGLLAGLVTLVQRDNGAQQAQREADRLRSLISLLREESVLSHQDFGLRIEADSYAVQRLDLDGHWQAAPGFRVQHLPESLRLHLQRDDEVPAPGEAPQLLVLSSDEVSPFTLRLEYRLVPMLALSSDGLEEVRLERLAP
ncbi:type II secretion system minor pseudopilin GspH [Pseudomonas sp. TCU-HL1]|uniref:type II secretion system minor pseudopilin GspH n=1 Tax=Pseudomonas sp. TCU-HL1 TaxID=1856685 RepID=UPI00083CEE1C|nr:type II secretion system minor pseudopilin GspH [Pseudomonas sp. TCU-HL1]AOE87591.1 general secretion pathway protein GspH [Pseudomonas sp. TCU-HL1]